MNLSTQKIGAIAAQLRLDRANSSRCPEGKSWVVNPDVKGGGFCRELPKSKPQRKKPELLLGSAGGSAAALRIAVTGLLGGGAIAVSALKGRDKMGKDLERERREALIRETQLKTQAERTEARSAIVESELNQTKEERDRVVALRDRILQVAEGLEKGLNRKKIESQKLRREHETLKTEAKEAKKELESLNEEYARNTEALLAERGRLTEEVQKKKESPNPPTPDFEPPGEDTTLGIPERTRKLPSIPPPKRLSSPTTQSDDKTLVNFQRDLGRIDRSLPLHRQNIEEFRAFEKNFPEEADLYKFYGVANAVSTPKNAPKGRNLTPFEGIENFLNTKASGKYQSGQFTYTDYMTLESNPVKSPEEYRQFLERTRSATKKPVADLYDRVSKQYINHYKSQGYSPKEADAMGREVSQAIYGDPKKYLEELDTAISDRIRAVDEGRIVVRDGNVYEKKNEFDLPSDDPIENYQKNYQRRSPEVREDQLKKLVRVLYGSDKVDSESLEQAFFAGLGEGIERRVVKDKLKGMAKVVFDGIIDVPFSDQIIDILADVDTQIVRTKSIGKQIIDTPLAMGEKIRQTGDEKLSRREAVGRLRDLVTPSEIKTLEDLVKSAAKDPARFTDAAKRIQNKIELEMVKRLEKTENGWAILNDRLFNLFGSRYDAEASLRQLQRIRKDKSPMLDYILDKLGYKGNPMTLEYRLHKEVLREAAKRAKRRMGGKFKDPKRIYKR